MFIYRNLSEDDQAELIHHGYSESDIQLIDRSIETTDYRLFGKDASLFEKGKKISAKKARSLLDTEEFLSGVGRSTLHLTAVRNLPDGRKIHFYASSKRF